MVIFCAVSFILKVIYKENLGVYTCTLWDIRELYNCCFGIGNIYIYIFLVIDLVT